MSNAESLYAENENTPITKNARRCGICGASADRYLWGFQCTSAPGHMSDLLTGIFTDCSLVATT